jgi:hypothetical protein
MWNLVDCLTWESWQMTLPASFIVALPQQPDMKPEYIVALNCQTLSDENSNGII